MRIPTPDYDEYVSGVMMGTELKNESHIVTVVGWGVEDGVKYWMIRNSAGENWGDGGMFKLVRGIDNLGLESHCVYAVPRDTWSEDLRNVTKEEKKEKRKQKKGKWWHELFK